MRSNPISKVSPAAKRRARTADSARARRRSSLRRRGSRPLLTRRRAVMGYSRTRRGRMKLLPGRGPPSAGQGGHTPESTRAPHPTFTRFCGISLGHAEGEKRAAVGRHQRFPRHADVPSGGSPPVGPGDDQDAQGCRVLGPHPHRGSLPGHPELARSSREARGPHREDGFASSCAAPSGHARPRTRLTSRVQTWQPSFGIGGAASSNVCHAAVHLASKESAWIAGADLAGGATIVRASSGGLGAACRNSGLGFAPPANCAFHRRAFPWAIPGR